MHPKYEEEMILQKNIGIRKIWGIEKSGENIGFVLFFNRNALWEPGCEWFKKLD